MAGYALLHRWLAVLVLLTLGACPVHADEQTHFDCLIDPTSVVALSTRETGTIDSFLVDRGDEVASGDVVALLDSDVESATVELARARAEMQAELDERQTDVEFTARDLARINDLYARKAISLTDKDRVATEAARAVLRLKQTQQQRRVALIELSRAQRLLERRTIRSPVSGLVMEKLLSPGESVEDRPIARIAVLDPLHIEVVVPVEHFGSIALGMQGKVLPKYPGASAQTAVVTVVDRVVDAASDTFGVRLELANPGNRILAGVRCEVEFGTNKSAAVAGQEQ